MFRITVNINTRDGINLAKGSKTTLKQIDQFHAVVNANRRDHHGFGVLTFWGMTILVLVGAIPDRNSKTDAAGKLVKQGDGDSGQTQRDHVRNFLDAVRSRKRESLNQEVHSGHVNSAMCHAGNISWRTGKKLRFDAETETFDDKQANQYVGREHRKGFELPNVS